MTTIACDGKSMASDGQRQHRGTITNTKAKKVRRLKDGTLVGTAGDVAFGESVVKWLDEGGDPPAFTGDQDAGFACLILYPSGDLWLGGQDCRPTKIEAPYSIGTGMDLAIGAMCAGASAKQAVAIASRYDPNTGGEITNLKGAQ